MTTLTPRAVLDSYPTHDYTLHGYFASRCAIDPSRPFLMSEARTWSWGEFGSAMEKAARVLVSQGIGRGDRVAVLAANSDAHVILMFAAARMGAIVVPLNPELGVEEIRYIMQHAGVSAVACSADTRQTAADACSGLTPAPWFLMVDSATADTPALDDLLKNPPDAQLPTDVNADETCIIVYSSGTTGFPKGIMHSHRTYLMSGEVHVARTHLQPDGRVLCMLPMFHVNALFYSLGSAIAAGAAAAIAPRFSASRFWDIVARYGATHTTVMAGVGAILVQRPRSEFVASHRLTVVNGSGFTPEILRVFRDEFHVPIIIEGFGMTEIPATFGNPYAGPHKLGSMGLPASHPLHDGPWTQARLLDDDGRDAPEGETGELAVRVPNFMQGYFRDPAQTASSMLDGWFLTGDLVRRDDDGFYFFVARKKDIIRRRGENISGAELDRILSGHPAVSEAAAIGVIGDLGDEEVMAVIALKAGATADAKEIQQWCAARLAAHKVPKFVLFMPALPHTPTHKIAKHALKKDPAVLAAACGRTE